MLGVCELGVQLCLVQRVTVGDENHRHRDIVVPEPSRVPVRFEEGRSHKLKPSVHQRGLALLKVERFDRVDDALDAAAVLYKVKLECCAVAERDGGDADAAVVEAVGKVFNNPNHRVFDELHPSIPIGAVLAFIVARDVGDKDEVEHGEVASG